MISIALLNTNLIRVIRVIRVQEYILLYIGVV